MATDSNWMIYGATGYTGVLTAERAVELGERPVVAGRSEAKVRPLAERLGLPWRVFSLDDADAVRSGLEGVDTALLIAGPFSGTSRPFLDGCLDRGVNYLDVTGEMMVFEAVLARSAEAKQRGIVAMPGVGMDVVPSDCLAAMLKQRLPDATHLELAIWGLGGLSPGTAKTMVEGLQHGSAERINGRIRPVPAGHATRTVRFASAERFVVAIPWGDVSTAFHTTGIPNVRTYWAMKPSAVKAMRLNDSLKGLYGLGLFQKAARQLIEWSIKGPDEGTRQTAKVEFWGEVRNAAGQSVEGRLVTPEGYTLTADAAVACVRGVRSGKVAPGAVTPGAGFGGEFILSLRGVRDLSFEGP
jgi:saccharopine dehydrogenase (NAD+, L-lysine-forming)